MAETWTKYRQETNASACVLSSNVESLNICGIEREISYAVSASMLFIKFCCLSRCLGRWPDVIYKSYLLPLHALLVNVMLREALAVTSTHDGWARLLKMFDVLAKEKCLTIYHCLPLTRAKNSSKLLVNCKECTGQEVRHSAIKNLSK